MNGPTSFLADGSKCFPGFDASMNCSVTFAHTLPVQWIVMRVLLLALPTVGLALTVMQLILAWRRGKVTPSYHLIGLVLLALAELTLLAYYAIDPGYLRAAQSGSYSESYAAGLFSLLVASLVFSGWASTFLCAFWLNLLWLHGRRYVFGFGFAALVATIVGVSWFFIVGALFIILMSMGKAYFSVFFGLLALIAVVEAVVVLASGSLVIDRLQKGFRLQQMADHKTERLQRIRVAVIGFAVAQILCSVGQFTVTFFTSSINSGDSGGLWIWVGVAYPGLLLGGAYFFILAAFRRKPRTLCKPVEERPLEMESAQAHSSL